MIFHTIQLKKCFKELKYQNTKWYSICYVWDLEIETTDNPR